MYLANLPTHLFGGQITIDQTSSLAEIVSFKGKQTLLGTMLIEYDMGCSENSLLKDSAPYHDTMYYFVEILHIVA